MAVFSRATTLFACNRAAGKSPLYLARSPSNAPDRASQVRFFSQGACLRTAPALTFPPSKRQTFIKQLARLRQAITAAAFSGSFFIRKTLDAEVSLWLIFSCQL